MRPIMSVSLATIALAVPLLVSALWEEAPQIVDPADAPAFLEIDSDHDGGISEDEAKQLPSLHNSFNDADLNQDGAIEPQEYLDAMGKTRVG